MKWIIHATAMTLIAVGSLPTASAQTLTVTVDCDRGQTITDALRQGDARKPLVVVVRGTCNEHVSIGRDDVTLRGQPGTGATVNGPNASTDTILILKDAVNIEDLTVTGGYNGIRLQGPSYAGVKNVLVRNTAFNGIIVRAGDIAIENSTVEYAGGSGLALARAASARVFGNSNFRHSHFNGIHAQNNSTVLVNGGTVSDNEGHGISLDYGSDGTISNVEIFNNATGIFVSTSRASVGGGNRIHHNRELGVLAQAGAVLGVDNNTIGHNGQDGVFGYLGTTVVMHGNEIADNGGTGVSCRSNCTLQIGGARITRNAYHGVVIQLRSTLILEAPVTDATGNGWVDLWCGDTESSADGLAEYFLGGTEGCTDFNN
jgi:hypothetical protein